MENLETAWTTGIEVKASQRARAPRRATRQPLRPQRHVVLRALAHAADLLQQVVDVLRRASTKSTSAVFTTSSGVVRVVEEVVVVGAVHLGQVLLGELRLLGPAARADAPHQHLGGRLQVDDEVGPRHALREQRVELLVDEQLAVVEVQVGEELALLEDVVGRG